VEYFVNQSFGTNVFHIHLQAGAPNKWDVQLGALLGMEATLDAIIHEGHEACCNDNTT
jgi:hypothetical protein